MSRADRRKQGQRGPKEPKAKPKLDAGNVALRDLRFDTPDASEMFLNLRYLDDAYVADVRVTMSEAQWQSGHVARFDYNVYEGTESASIGRDTLIVRKKA